MSQNPEKSGQENPLLPKLINITLQLGPDCQRPIWSMDSKRGSPLGCRHAVPAFHAVSNHRGIYEHPSMISILLAIWDTSKYTQIHSSNLINLRVCSCNLKMKNKQNVHLTQ